MRTRQNAPRNINDPEEKVRFQLGGWQRFEHTPGHGPTSAVRRAAFGDFLRLHQSDPRTPRPVRAEAEDQSYRDFLATLIAEEVAHRAQTRIKRSVRKARFPFLRTIEDFDFTFQSSIRLQLLGSCLGPELVSEGRSLILCGPSGTGKTHLAIAIAYRAIQNGYEALFTSAAEMIETLSVAIHRGELARTLAHYTHPPVLVIDEEDFADPRPHLAPDLGSELRPGRDSDPAGT